MFHWFAIILGIIFLACSISNPVYNLTVKKYINSKFLINSLLRILMTILGICLIFFGLYIESIF